MHPPISLPEKRQSPTDEPQTVGSSSWKDSRPVTLSTKSVAWNGNESCEVLEPSRNSRFSVRLGCHSDMPKSPKLPQYTVATSCSAVILNMSVELSE